jgi:hypothetical protein
MGIKAGGVTHAQHSHMQRITLTQHSQNQPGNPSHNDPT